MKSIIKYTPFIFIFFVFRNWFLHPKIIGGDWPFFYPEFLREFHFSPSSWLSYENNGLGGQTISYALDSYLYFTTSLFVNVFHIPWEISYKTFFFGLFIVSSIVSSTYLGKTIFPKVHSWTIFLSAFIFCTNTYILMVVGGGQMGIALAYSLVPLVLAKFIKTIQDEDGTREQRTFLTQDTIIAALLLAVQTVFDVRITFLTMGVVILYFLFNVKYRNLSKENLTTIIYSCFSGLITPIVLTILLHAFWLLPILVFRSTPVQQLVWDYGSTGLFQFLSFADFSHTIGLLHPNWPEDIFGKTYFMKPEFLLLPIIAFSSLLFMEKNNQRHLNKNILFFALLGLLGAFLAKGTNPPFGQINSFIYQNIPGFAIFRDPTKWYIFIAIAYAILIPFSILRVGDLLESQIKSPIRKYIQFSSFLIVFGFLLFLISPALLGELNGTFKSNEVPNEYIKLKDLLYMKPEFFRTLWIPRRQRYNFFSSTHPAVEAIELFHATTSAQIITRLRSENAQKYLEDLAIKYVIVPYDPKGEIFIQDRKYDERQYNLLIQDLDSIHWLRRVNGFSKVAVYETPAQKDHFWLDTEEKISYQMVTPAKYLVNAKITRETSIVFSETYNSYWVMKDSNSTIYSQETETGLNRFLLSKEGNYQVEISFSQEKYYQYGKLISLATLIILFSTLFWLHKVEKRGRKLHEKN